MECLVVGSPVPLSSLHPTLFVNLHRHYAVTVWVLTRNKVLATTSY